MPVHMIHRYRVPEISYFALIEGLGVEKGVIQSVIDRYLPENEPDKELTRDEFRAFIVELIDLI